MGNKQSSKNKYDKCELLITGFLRNCAHSIAGDDITQLCYRYYLIQQLLFMNDASFHALDVSSAYKPFISTNILNTNEASIQPKPFDVSCYIPNILPLISTENISEHINLKVQYDAILSRKMKWVNIDYKHLQTSRFLYIFKSDAIPNNFRSDYNLLQSNYTATQQMESILYCNDFGIIGIDAGFNVYQLKLKDIKQNDFDFNEISSSADITTVWNSKRFSNECHTFPQTIYIPSRFIFAIECVYDYEITSKKKHTATGSWCAKCGLYDFSINEWVSIEDYYYSAHLEDQYNFQCGLFYQRQRNIVFLVSNIGHVAEYNFDENKWNTLYQDYNNKEMIFSKAPIIWSYEYLPYMVYCAAAKYNKKYVKYELQFRCIDLRQNKKKWMKCMVDTEQKAKILVDFNYLFT